MFPLGVGLTRYAIINRIFEYSRRSLTHQSDRLNALLGILRVFEGRGTYQCWGTPIFPSSVSLRLEPSEQDLNMGFLPGLCGMFYPTSRSNIRIPNLPSWSWTGWSDSICYDDRILEGLTSVVQVSVELRDRSVLDWNEFHRRYAEINNSVQLSYLIHVWAPTFEIQNLSQNRDSHDLEVKMEDGWFLRWKFHSCQNGICTLQATKTLVLASDGEGRKFLVFFKQFEDGWERVLGCWKHCSGLLLLGPDHKMADVFNYPNNGSDIIERYGVDWEKSIASTWETLRIG